MFIFRFYFSLFFIVYTVIAKIMWLLNLYNSL